MGEQQDGGWGPVVVALGTLIAALCGGCGLAFILYEGAAFGEFGIASGMAIWFGIVPGVIGLLIRWAGKSMK